MIVNVRGTMGAGKTTIMRGLIHDFWCKTKYGRLGHKLPEAYVLSIPKIGGDVFVLGPYVAQNGGCDRIQDHDIIMELIDKYDERGHVLYEHLGLSITYGRFGKRLEKGNNVIAFMDTPLERCIMNVEERRAARGEKRRFRTDFITEHYAKVQRAKRRAEKLGKVKVVEFSFGKGREQLLDLLKKA